MNPSGTFLRGIALPTLASAVSLAIIVSPTVKFSGFNKYFFAPFAYETSIMRTLRFGSYSIVHTLPKTLRSVRLKSMMRYFLSAPPPR